MKYSLKYLPLMMLVSACSGTSAISEQTKSLSAPAKWQAKHADNKTHKSINVENWLAGFQQPQLAELVEITLKNNYSLLAQQAQLLAAKERVTVANASDFPELNLSLSQSRRKSVFNEAGNYTNSADINLQLSYEVDLWGKLSAEQQNAQLTYASARATYQQAELSLIADVTKVWFSLVEAQQLLSLYQERARNLQKNLDMIQSSYRLGLSKALDVYLTQNDVNRELARVAQQQQIRDNNSRSLELLLGQYPSASLLAEASITVVEGDIELGLPAELLTNRFDIQASWYDLLASDASLAVAHKNRFPRIALSASTGDSSSELSDLLDGSALAWSLVGNLTQPIFNAGRLASVEEQARLQVKQKEQLYLQKVFNAFSQVEGLISNNASLKQRVNHYQKAKENALNAEKIAFDQYMKGLVTYTTVLESQRRAFDAQTSLIQLQNQLLQNRVNLFVALGGSPFSKNQLSFLNSHQEVKSN